MQHCGAILNIHIYQLHAAAVLSLPLVLFAVTSSPGYPTLVPESTHGMDTGHARDCKIYPPHTQRVLAVRNQREIARLTARVRARNFDYRPRSDIQYTSQLSITRIWFDKHGMLQDRQKQKKVQNATCRKRSFHYIVCKESQTECCKEPTCSD